MNQNAQIYKKKSHPFRGLLIFFIVLLVIIALPVGVAYILFYDGASKEVKVNENETMETYMESYKKNVIVNSLEDTKTTGKIAFTVGENELNPLLYYALRQRLDHNATQYITKAYLEVDKEGKQYNFYIDASTPFFPYFKTRIKMSATIEDLKDEKGFSLQIKNLGAGRINGLLSFADQFITESMVKGIFEGMGLGLKVDWKNHKVTCSLNDLLTSLGFVSSSSTGNFFYNIISDTLTTNPQLITTDYYTYSGINIGIDLSSAHDVNAKAPLDYSSAINSTKEALKNTADLNEDTITSKFNEYAEGIKPTSDKDLTDYLDEHRDNVNLKTYLSEEEINTYLRTTDLIGKVYPFFGTNDNGENKFAFIIVNDFYIDLKAEQKASFYINLDINGYNTQMVLDTTISDKIVNDGDKLAFNFNMTNMNYGTISLFENGEPKSFVNDMIKEGFEKGESGDIKVDGKTISVQIEDDVFTLNKKVTSYEDRIEIELDKPNVFKRAESPSSTTTEGAIGDYWLNILTSDVYTKESTGWTFLGNALDPVWATANPEIIALLALL